ncbi:hypothetical protein BX666DRAFT_2135103 [Dichotomocladium elegans]|nr:hypothetical protein BX666DRAFT_2135103 [Dichotomocladium elegans]
MPKSSPNTSTATKKVPRPMNCFLAFRLEKQNEIVARCPGANHRDISKIIAKYWKEMSEEEKEPYRRRAHLAKLEHEKLYPGYKYQPQKKNGRKTRKYERKVKDTFTSRNHGNNRMMEIFYKNPRMLDDCRNIRTETTSPRIEQRQQQTSTCTIFNEEAHPVMGNVSVAPTTPSPLMSDVNSPLTIEEPTISYYADQNGAFIINPLFAQQPYPQHVSYSHEITGLSSMPLTHYTATDVPVLDGVTCSAAPFNYTFFDTLSYYTHPISSCIDPQLLTCEQEIMHLNMLENSEAKQFKQNGYCNTYECSYDQL